MDLSKLINVLTGLVDKLDTLNAILLIFIIIESGAFYFAIKILWEAYKTSQDNRIEENKNMIKVQESTTTALNNLSKVVEVGFNLISKK